MKKPKKIEVECKVCGYAFYATLDELDIRGEFTCDDCQIKDREEDEENEEE